MIYRLFLEIPSVSLIDLQTVYSFEDAITLNEVLDRKNKIKKEIEDEMMSKMESSK